MQRNHDFFNWLAGYIDGEGTFGCYVRSDPKPQAAVYMRVAARADEYPLLAECQERTGLGRLVFCRRVEGHTRGHQPAWRWGIESKKDCESLVELLERYPLRSKKAEDFKVWAQIVRERAGWAHRGNDMSRIIELAGQLKEVRQYADTYEPKNLTAPAQAGTVPPMHPTQEV